MRTLKSALDRVMRCLALAQGWRRSVVMSLSPLPVAAGCQECKTNVEMADQAIYGARRNGGEFTVRKSERLIICAECGVQVGTGHVMRCLALAQAWKRAGGDVTFRCRKDWLESKSGFAQKGFCWRRCPKRAGCLQKGLSARRSALTHPSSCSMVTVLARTSRRC